MEEIAERCGVSKSMLYHYFRKKEDILAEMLRLHVSRLIDDIADFKNNVDLKSGAEIIRGFVEVYMETSNTARARHVVALHDARYLTDAQRAEQTKTERKLIDLASSVIAMANPHLDRPRYRTYCLLLIGMMNWSELWFHRSGPIEKNEFYDRISGLFLSGFEQAII